MFGWFKKKAELSPAPIINEIGVANVVALKEIILERPDLKQRLIGASPLDVFIAEVVAMSVEQDLPFSKEDFLLYAERTGKSLPAVCMAYFGGGLF